MRVKEWVVRIAFPEDEKKHSWLAPLLDAYAVVDEGVAEAVRRGEERSGKKLACRRACDSCCRTQRDIPLYPHEMTGIYWYCAEKIRQPTRAVLRRHLAGHGPGRPCPFLLEGVCAIHPLRPAGCRQFNVLGEPCAEGEDPFHTRRHDVVAPPRDVIRRAFAATLGFYGTVEGRKATKEIIEKVIHTQVISLHDVDWRKLAARMATRPAGGSGGHAAQ